MVYLHTITFTINIISSVYDKKRALISGISGQDGAYLAKFLIKKAIMYSGVRGKMRAVIYGVLRSWVYTIRLKLFHLNY